MLIQRLCVWEATEGPQTVLLREHASSGAVQWLV